MNAVGVTKTSSQYAAQISSMSEAAPSSAPTATDDKDAAQPAYKYPLCANSTLSSNASGAFARVMLGADSATESDLAETTSLIVEGGPTVEGTTTVMIAAYVGNVDYLRSVKDLSHFQRCASSKRSVTEFAMRGCQIGAVRYLHEIGALTHEPSDLPREPVYVAVHSGFLEGVRFVKEVCGRSLGGRLECGESLLALVARRGNVALARYLLEKCPEIDVNWTRRIEFVGHSCYHFENAFFTAVRTAQPCRLSMVRLMIEFGAHRDTLRLIESSLSVARAVVAVAVADSSSSSSSVGAADAEPSSVYYVKHQYFPALPQSDCAALADRSVCTGMYAVRSCAPRVRSTGPLHEACRQRDVAVLKVLCEEAGFAIDKGSIVGDDSPLSMACRSGSLECIKYLVETQRVDVNQRSRDGCFPLYSAARGGRASIVQLLLAHGAKSHLTWLGSTAFVAAVSGGHVDVVPLFIEYKADVTTPYNGMTPLEIARNANHAEIVRLLTR